MSEWLKILGQGGWLLITGGLAAAAAVAQPCASGPAPALVTVATAGDERFVVRVREPALLAEMVAICEGRSPDRIVNGRLVTGSAGYNRDPATGRVWSWHLAEEDLELADFTIELCDGQPSMVEAGLEEWLGSGRFCPWSSRIVAVSPDQSRAGDFDLDGRADGADSAFLEACLGAPGAPCYRAGEGCCGADLDADQDVDCTDWCAFLAAWSVAPEAPPAVGRCMHQPALVQRGRFRLELLWRGATGQEAGSGEALTVTPDSGYFRLSARGGVGALVRVVDGRPVNGRFWVLYGFLSDAEAWIRVTDTASGEERTYHNPPAQLTRGSDTEAF